MNLLRRALVAMLVLAACSDGNNGRDVMITDEEIPPQWYFTRVEHGLGNAALLGIWSRSDGRLFVVGWGGLIMTQTEPGVWVKMPSGTTENITAIYGINNGALFGLPAVEGEMVAVGWHGTVLHYHPNPDGNATTDDGAWSAISGPTVAQGFVPRIKIDPACPDYDGDGLPDDGDGDGYWGNALCVEGATTACDDNCRKAPNGSLRPYVDTNGDACIGPGDAPGDASVRQRDLDGDGVGSVCDSDDDIPNAQPRFSATLFDVVIAPIDANQFRIVAVGEEGAVVSFEGVSAALAAQAGAPVVTDATGWIAQTGAAFRYENDCAPGTPAGTVCTGSGRLPPACPAQCHPVKTVCSCPVNQGQCCDATASTGAACVDGSCSAAPNACNAASGECSTLCPACFRRLDETLRSVAFDGDVLVAVGSQGTVLTGALSDPTNTWTAPSCVPVPVPLDQRPLLTAVSAAGGGFVVVGAGGAALRFGGAGCSFSPLNGVGVFYSSIFATSGAQAYAVGDRGVLMAFNANGAEQLNTEVVENFQDITVVNDPERGQLLFAVGAGGLILHGDYY